MKNAVKFPDAFNGDYLLYLHIANLKKKHGLLIAVETGTFMGQSTKALCEIFGAVFTIEKNTDYFRQATENLRGIPNLTKIQASSPDGIRGLGITPPDNRFFFFLDAHWESYNPLLDELREIARKQIKPVIVIHDFFVPGKSDPRNPAGPFGFDVYGGQPYVWDWIAPAVAEIYGADGFHVEYPESVAGAARGYVTITPKGGGQ